MANFWMALFVGLVVFILADVPIIYCSITCRNQEGKNVDWFIIYKLPRLDDSPIPIIRDGYAYYYMDVDAPKWTFGKVPMNNTGQAVSHTLQQIYDNHKSKDVAYFLYNDETPSKSSSNSHGHTKGDVCFDKFSGFWLVHSVPKFPPDASAHYLYPKSGSYFGQMFLCVTYKYSSLNEIGKQMIYIYPEIYDYNLPESFEAANPNLIPVVHGKHVASPPWNRSTTLVSEGGQKFTSFAKFTNFDADLYHDWVAPYYKSDIYVESWLNGIHPMSTNCTGKYKAYNIREVNVSQVFFKHTYDHSKWAVTGERDWTCIGDINRMESQEQRAGGTVCFQISPVSHLFTQSITMFEPCHKYSVKEQPNVITVK